MNKKITLLVIFCCCIAVLQAKSLEIKLTKAESLSDFISAEDIKSTTQLHISGPIGGNDIKLIREMAGGGFNEMENTEGCLEHLDLSKAHIVESEHPYYRMGEELFTKNNCLGTFMFYNCSRLTSIVLPDNLEAIEYAVFSHTQIESIFIPQKVKLITESFEEASLLQEIIIADSNPYYQSIDGVIFSEDSDTLHIFPNGRTGNYIIPKNTKHIAPNAFRGCHINYVDIPESITEISEMAFYNCDIKVVNLPQETTKIGKSAFSDCNHLERIYIPSNIKRIDYRAFAFLPKLKEVYISATNPPSCNNPFEGSLGDNNPVLYIPNGCLENYSQAYGYNFGAFSRIKEYCTTGNSSNKMNRFASEQFFINGWKALEQSQGLLIQSQSDGRFVKVLVRP
ncbi:MAG: leucine-rich repeat domain-containing protein [Bacteroidales bacterium]|nr:leucine-rich repeat domain-containing protein [Bacteroidales bacterium]